MSSIQVIVNPVAGAGKTEKLWPSISAFMDKLGLSYEAVVTEYPGHAIHLVQKAVNRGYKTLVAVGGDGTLNEVVNGLYHSGLPDDCGSGGNMYRYRFGLYQDNWYSCRLWPSCSIVVKKYQT
jgi:diacylglycerol kinase family enzyme